MKRQIPAAVFEPLKSLITRQLNKSTIIRLAHIETQWDKSCWWIPVTRSDQQRERERDPQQRRRPDRRYTRQPDKHTNKFRCTQRLSKRAQMYTLLQFSNIISHRGDENERCARRPQQLADLISISALFWVEIGCTERGERKTSLRWPFKVGHRRKRETTTWNSHRGSVVKRNGEGAQPAYLSLVLSHAERYYAWCCWLHTRPKRTHAHRHGHIRRRQARARVPQ